MTTEISKIENQIMELSEKLAKLRKKSEPQKIKNYTFTTETGKTTLLDLFAGKDTLFAIHNMGQACRYCTLWADGLNGFVPHLEDQHAVVLLSKDKPEIQRQFANDRGWRFRMASHGGKGDYVSEQSVDPTGKGMPPGMVVYTRKGDQIFRKNAVGFGPGDLYCSFWHVLNAAGLSENEVTPQYHYWKRPEKLEDGGQNIL